MKKMNPLYKSAHWLNKKFFLLCHRVRTITISRITTILLMNGTYYTPCHTTRVFNSKHSEQCLSNMENKRKEIEGEIIKSHGHEK